MNLISRAKHTIRNTLALLAATLFGAAATAGEKTSFAEVEKNLDRDGAFYLYFDGKNSFQALEVWLQNLGALITQEAGKDNAEAKEAFNSVLSVYRASGLNTAGGFGVSSIRIDNGLYRTKTLLHCPKGKDQGFFWGVFGKPPHQMQALKMMPATTVLAAANDFDAKNTWKALKDCLAKEGQAELAKKLQEAEAELKTKGFDLDKIFASYDGELGYMISLDKSKMIKLPFTNPQTPIEIPTPGLAIFAKAKDDALIEMIAAKTSMLQKTERNGAKILTMSLPVPIPMPFLQPALAKKGDYLVFASSLELLDSMFAAMDGGPGLAATENFKRLSQDIPLSGNGFMYCDRLLLETFMKASSGIEGTELDIKSLYKIMGLDSYEYFHVVSKTDAGILCTINCNKSGVSMLASQAFAPLAGALLPALNSAREKARRISCASNLKQIGLALKMYSMDNKDLFPVKNGVEGLEELRKNQYLSDPKFYICPNASTTPGKLADPLSEKVVDYIYLGGWTEANSPDLPIAFEKPGMHDGFVNILFLDGHVEGKEIDYDSAAELVSILIESERYEYSDTEKKTLQQKAAAIDKALGYNADPNTMDAPKAEEMKPAPKAK